MIQSRGLQWDTTRANITQIGLDPETKQLLLDSSEKDLHANTERQYHYARNAANTGYSINDVDDTGDCVVESLLHHAMRTTSEVYECRCSFQKWIKQELTDPNGLK